MTIPFKLSPRALSTLNPLFKRLLLVTLCVYLALFGYNSLTRIRKFTPDSMNYVNVARNISTGKGITQPTIGFNQPRFAATDSIPVPFTAQPPLYPLVIACVGCGGLSPADSALLLSMVCYGGLLLFAFRLAVDIYNESAGHLVLGLLLLYYPLSSVANKACSEPLAILLALASLWLLVRGRASSASLLLAGAGLTAGLAFATRYLFAPVYAVGLLFLMMQATIANRQLRDVILYTIGFALPAGGVLARNFWVMGTVMPPVNPSTLGLRTNVRAAVTMFWGGYAGLPLATVQVCAMGLLLSVLVVALLRRSRMEGVRGVFGKEGRILLSAWTGGYMILLILQRTQLHFDTISPRLVAPAGVTAAILLSALLVDVIRSRLVYILAFVLVVTFGRIGVEGWISLKTPPNRAAQTLEGSERLQWIAKNTTAQDLIIGNDTMDVPFYLPGRETVSFSPFPYTDYASYARVMAYCRTHRDRYHAMYLIVRRDTRGEQEWRASYGEFFTEVVFGRRQRYPGVLFVQRLKDAYVFQIRADR